MSGWRTAVQEMIVYQNNLSLAILRKKIHSEPKSSKAFPIYQQSITQQAVISSNNQSIKASLIIKCWAVAKVKFYCKTILSMKYFWSCCTQSILKFVQSSFYWNLWQEVLFPLRKWKFSCKQIPRIIESAFNQINFLTQLKAWHRDSTWMDRSTFLIDTCVFISELYSNIAQRYIIPLICT